MTAGPQGRLFQLLRGMTPVLLTLFLVLVNAVPSGLPHFSPLTPTLAMMAVYYWSIFRPELMPASAVFGIGLLQDVISGGPIGLMALVLVLIHGICVSQRRVFLSKSFMVGWWGFMMVAAGTTLIGYIAACLYYGTLFNPLPVLAQSGLTVALYPPFNWLFVRAEQRLLRIA